ncbi:YraN family protein [Candidatus Peregrinibacteria bacterium]|nr:YraN family protein [Candidatus Peregrinibacteria bacterium]
MDNKKLGKLGEKIAEKFLIAQKYKILEKNFHSRYGEIDIIAVDLSKKPQIVFVEIKTRTSVLFGEPQEAVSFTKKAKILKTALYFLNSARQKLPFIWRIDIIALKLDRKRKIIDINHIKNIFDG